jgi:XTP/dITP diphosphohydrolase
VRLVVATTNQNKVREIRQLLAGAPVDIITLAEWPGLEAPEETGATFEENARAKALYYAAATGELTVAEDSGLSIDALDGAPGIESARFGGVDLPYPQKFLRIGAALRAKGAAESPAQFVCALALVRGDRVLFETRGTIDGRISPQPKGEGGFGYDPIFVPEGRDETMAELSPEQKDRISHRGRAFRALRNELASAEDGPFLPNSR